MTIKPRSGSGLTEEGKRDAAVRSLSWPSLLLLQKLRHFREGGNSLRSGTNHAARERLSMGTHGQWLALILVWQRCQLELVSSNLATTLHTALS